MFSPQDTSPDQANFWSTELTEESAYLPPPAFGASLPDEAAFWGAPSTAEPRFAAQDFESMEPMYAAPEPVYSSPQPVYAAQEPVSRIVQPAFSASSIESFNLEQLALQCGIPPVKLPRSAASIPAENLLRTFGLPSTSSAPWIPLGTLGPLIIMGHFQPDCQDYWNIPSFLVVKVLIQPAQYQSIYEDLLNRLSHKPLARTNPNCDLPPPPSEDGLKAVLDWFITSYPMADVEREKLKKLVEERGSKPVNGLDDLKFLPRHYGVAIIALHTPGQQIYNPEEAPGQSLFPDSLLEKHNVYPLHCSDQHVWLLSAVPSTYAFEDEWLSSGHDAIRITNILADPSAISGAIARNRGRGSRDTGASVQVGELTYSDNQNIIEIDPLDMSKVNPANPNTPPDELVKWVIYRALTMRVSDLHIEKFYNTSLFRSRIDGELVVIHSCSEESLLRYIAIIKNWSNMAQERQTTQDGRFSMRLGKKRIDVRVAAVPHRKEMQKIIMRFLDKQDGIKKLSELNMSTRQSSIIKQVLARDQGLALVTGPTGSGKTTTLYAFLNAINEDNINIQTIEDPIEYEIEGINQTQTDTFHGLDFPTGLRALLRADPDVILIGESRDAETAGAAINAALTGHLVLTTLHANDSLRAISRLLSMGIESYLLADALALSQAQRLVRRLCPYCKSPVNVTPEIQDFLFHHGAIEQAMAEPIYQKVGCDECNGTGYTGRIALMEMCLITNELSGLIAEGAPVVNMRKVAIQGGFKSLYQEGLVQVVAGNTTFDEINCLSYTAMG